MACGPGQVTQTYQMFGVDAGIIYNLEHVSQIEISLTNEFHSRVGDRSRVLSFTGGLQCRFWSSGLTALSLGLTG